MNKQEFLGKLRSGLSGLPQGDVEERLTFYSEMIDDRMEEGISEEEAVCEIGSVDEIVSQIIADIPFTKLVREKIKPNRTLRPWEIVLLVLGSPVWLSRLAVPSYRSSCRGYCGLCGAVVADNRSVGCRIGSLLCRSRRNCVRYRICVRRQSFRRHCADRRRHFLLGSVDIPLLWLPGGIKGNIAAYKRDRFGN